jgi:hypothetical protein
VTSTALFAAEERDWNPSARAGWFAMADAPSRVRPPALSSQEITGLPPAGRRRYDQARAIWHANLGPIRTPQVDAVFEVLEEICGSNLQDGGKARPAAVLDALPGLGKTTAALALVSPRADPGARPAGANRRRVVAADPGGLSRPDPPHHDAQPERDAVPVTFLFAGVGLRARGLLDEGLAGAGAAYSQTARRWNVLTLEPFEITTPAGQRIWRQLLLGIERELVLPGAWRGMVAADPAQYLFIRSSGHFASLMSLISRGCYRAVKTGAESLTAALLDAVRIDQAAEDARGQLKRHIAAYHMGKLAADPAALQALTELAFAIDAHHIPISYQRRRDLTATTTLIDSTTWTTIARDAGMRAGRLQHARRYLYELLTGCSLRTAPPRYQLTSGTQASYHDFTLGLPASLASALHQHARHLLHTHRINGEPLEWQPPPSWVTATTWPGADPAGQQPGVLYLDPAWLREEYLTWHRSLNDIAHQIGCPVITLNTFAHQHGIPVRPRGNGMFITDAAAPGHHPRDLPEPLRSALTGRSARRRLHHLLAIAEHPSIRQAAQTLGIWPGALHSSSPSSKNSYAARPSTTSAFSPAPSGKPQPPKDLSP